MENSSRKRTRRTIAIVIVIVVGLFGGQIWITNRFIQQDRRDTIERFIGERHQQMQRAVVEVESSLLNLLDPFRLLAQLVQSDDFTRYEQSVEAVLRHQSGLNAVSVWGAKKQQKLFKSLDVVDPINNLPANEPLKQTLLKSALVDSIESRENLGTSPSKIDTTGRILRAFVRPVGPEDNPQYVGVVVDMRKVFDQLETVTSDIGSELVVLGPEGDFEPPSTIKDLRRPDDQSDEEVGYFIDQMLSEDTGAIRLDSDVTEQFELKEGGYVLTHDSFHLTPRLSWSVGIMTSLKPASESAEAIFWRIGMLSGVVSLLLFGFGGLIVYSVRKQGRLEERLEHAEEVEHLHAKLEAIFDAIPTGVVAVDGEFQVQELNSEMVELLGGDVEGRRLDELWESQTGSSFEKVSDHIGASDNKEEGSPVLIESVDFGDGPRHLQVQAVSISREGSSDYVVLAFHDVTAIKRLESQLLRTEKLSTVGVLAAGVAHEIGTPLGVIKGRADYALSQEPTESIQEHLEIIVEQSEYIQNIVQEILDFSRNDEPNIESTDVAQVFSRSIQLATLDRSAENPEILTDVPDELSPIAANPDKFQQVIVNLLVNAIQACESDGTIELSATELERDGRATVRVTIDDDGEGIPPDKKHKIFDPFFTTKRRGQGTGLGLAVVQKIVRDHDAEIQVESSVGEGTRFDIFWPQITAS